MKKLILATAVLLVSLSAQAETMADKYPNKVDVIEYVFYKGDQGDIRHLLIRKRLERIQYMVSARSSLVARDKEIYDKLNEIILILEK